MKNKIKQIIIFLFIGCLLLSCADSKEFKISEKEYIYAEPYGFANKDARKDENVIYEICFGNVVWSIIGIETIIIPVWLIGWEIYEPVKLKKCAPDCEDNRSTK